MPVQPGRERAVRPTSRHRLRNNSAAGFLSRGGSSISSAASDGKIISAANPPPTTSGGNWRSARSMVSQAPSAPPDRLPVLSQPAAAPRSYGGSVEASSPPLQLDRKSVVE